MYTFWEKPRIPTVQVLAEIPAISKIVIALDQFDLVPLHQGQLVGTSGFEVVCQVIESVRLMNQNGLRGSILQMHV